MKTDFRLTATDQTAIRGAIRGAIRAECRLNRWPYLTTSPRDATTREALIIAGAAAIGCTTTSLRQTELDWIWTQVVDQMGVATALVAQGLIP